MRLAVLDGHIGLAAVSERVSALGGALSISTAPGAGTVVRITLPATPGGSELARGSAEICDRVTPRDTLRVSPA
jgi:signal transduction histidine kinase